MKLTGYGNASVKVECAGAALFFDPYQKDLVPVAETAEQGLARRAALLEAHDIFITHGHFDHLGSVTALHKDRDVAVYCTETPARSLAAQGFPAEKLHVIKPGDTVSVGGAAVTAYHTEHCRFNAGEVKNVILHHQVFKQFGQLQRLLRLNAAYPSGGECLLYEIEGEGKRVQLLGSAGLDRGTDYPVGADALVLPYQGRSDMADYCMGIVEHLRPRRVILDHFDDSFPPMTCREDVTPFLRNMKRAHPETPCAALDELETIEI